MPVRVEWQVRHRVIYERYWGHVSSEDLSRHIDACVQMLADAQQQAPLNTVHLFADALEAESIFPIYKAVAQGVRPLNFSNRGNLYLVTRNRSHQLIIEIAARIGRFPMHVFSDLQSALAAVAIQVEADA